MPRDRLQSVDMPNAVEHIFQVSRVGFYHLVEACYDRR